MPKLAWCVRLSGLLVLFAMLACAPAAHAQSREQLENQKLEEEVRQLRIANDRSGSTREDILDYAPFITVLVALLGAGIPLWKEVRDRRMQRESELKQSQREEERREEEQFATAIANLDSEKSQAARVSAAISLAFFAGSGHARFRDKVFPILCAHLVTHQPRAVNRYLVQAFEKALSLKVTEVPREGEEKKPLDLARFHLDHVELADLDLKEADLAFAHLRRASIIHCNLRNARGYKVHIEKAQLSRSTLTDARLHKAHGEEARFHDATMNSVKLREAGLPKTEFYRATLQEAHFDRADLRGATFDQADVTEAYFCGALLDEKALKSLINTKRKSWERAHFDPEVGAELRRLDQRRREKKRSRGD